MARLKGTFISLVFFLFSNFVYAQPRYSNWELGLAAGGAGYMGDLNQNNPLLLSGGSAELYVKRNFSEYLGVRLNYTFGQINGNDANSNNEQFRNRNLAFKTNLNELSAIADFNFIGFRLNGDDRRLTPYVFAGAGLLLFDPTVKYDGTRYKLAELKTEGQEKPYSRKTLTIPYGVGFRYQRDGGFSIFSEIGYRTPNTDYLDDVSGLYSTSPALLQTDKGFINFSDPSPNKAGVPGTQRGDFRKRDTYLFVNVGISITFVSAKCYSF
ncbi:MAG: outer membrane beta-barrel protein [Pedobacter sp.]|nr:outer membrane beta-barrel protein [Pedobacter sp.]